VLPHDGPGDGQADAGSFYPGGEAVIDPVEFVEYLFSCPLWYPDPPVTYCYYCPAIFSLDRDFDLPFLPREFFPRWREG